jgi:hypothetical protein
VPGIHVFLGSKQDVDGRDKPGHDEHLSPALLRLDCDLRRLEIRQELPRRVGFDRA